MNTTSTSRNTGRKTDPVSVEIYETSAQGKALEKIDANAAGDVHAEIQLYPGDTYQAITGFGGSFTEASAYLLNRLSPGKRDAILQAYFGENGARYSLTRTHINSCDFSRRNYAYAMTPGDLQLENFSIEADRSDLIPMIKAAQACSTDGFRIIASPWTAPPWMKDNQDWRGGKLLPEYRATWALYFEKYIRAYRNEGIDIWGITVENEPLGNNNNWESMHYTPEEMAAFVRDFLGPHLEKSGLADVRILGYDQNRGAELVHWANVLYADEASSKYLDGLAVHWYASTVDCFPASLQHAHARAPQKHLINTEACIDAQAPAWKNDAWYWREEATDWGWHWASETDRHLHPKYAPAFRYAGDIIGCLNNWVDGWIDWNMVLDKQGGPNWFRNWCTAPVIADIETDEIYFTPLYYVMAHFSRFIRPGAARIGFTHSHNDLMVTAARNPDDSLVTILFNPTTTAKTYRIAYQHQQVHASINAKAIQTIQLN